MTTETPQRRATDPIILEMHSNIAVLCNQMEQLVGNGQPGIIMKLDGRVASLEGTRSTVTGWLRGVAWIIGGAMTLIGFIYTVAKAVAAL